MFNSFGVNSWNSVIPGGFFAKKTGMPFFLLLPPENEFLQKFSISPGTVWYSERKMFFLMIHAEIYTK